MVAAVVTGAIGAHCLRNSLSRRLCVLAKHRDLRAQVARLGATIQAERQRQQSLENYFRGRGRAADSFTRAEFLNSLIDERSFPWTKILPIWKTLCLRAFV